MKLQFLRKSSLTIVDKKYWQKILGFLAYQGLNLGCKIDDRLIEIVSTSRKLLIETLMDVIWLIVRTKLNLNDAEDMY